jgi:small subunit ribosomal protein S20
MPVTQSASRALRKDRKRTVINAKLRSRVRSTIKNFSENPSGEQLNQVYSIIDRAVKKNLFHANKAARMKSKLAAKIGLVAKPVKKAATKPKKTVKKIKSPKKST